MNAALNLVRADFRFGSGSGLIYMGLVCNLLGEVGVSLFLSVYGFYLEYRPRYDWAGYDRTRMSVVLEEMGLGVYFIFIGFCIMGGTGGEGLATSLADTFFNNDTHAVYRVQFLFCSFSIVGGLLNIIFALIAGSKFRPREKRYSRAQLMDGVRTAET